MNLKGEINDQRQSMKQKETIIDKRKSGSYVSLESEITSVKPALLYLSLHDSCH